MTHVLLALALFLATYLPPCATVDVSRILFVGNSLTWHMPLGIHTGVWGMAASQADKDYVHRVQLQLAADTGTIPEIAITRYDVGWDDAKVLATAEAFKPALVVVQVGDNATAGHDEYVATLTGLMGALRADGRTVVLTGVWYSAQREAWNAEVAQATGARFVPIQDAQSMATIARADCWDTDPVCTHPGDAGMAEIARRIVAALKQNEWSFIPWITNG